MLVATAIATAMVTAVTVRYHAFWIQNLSRKDKRIRQKVRVIFLLCWLVVDNTLFNLQLPGDLDTWRIPGNCQEAEEKIWQDLDEVFRDRGFALWANAFCCTLVAPSEPSQLSSGFAYATPSRGIGDGLGTVDRLRRFDYIVCLLISSLLSSSDLCGQNPLTRIARTQEGHDIAVRVIVIRRQGDQHLKILRKIATGPYSLFSNNHTLPMLGEFQFEDIIFGLFPKAGGTMEEAFGYWPKNSVGDVIDMLMQALEVSLIFSRVTPCVFFNGEIQALAFIHDLHIAHRVSN